jgi:hypothetical protein
MMARQGRVILLFECLDCQVKIRLSLFYGEKMIWNNSTSPTLQKLKPHEKHNVQVTYHFETDR